MQSESIIGCGYTGRRLAERLQKSSAYVRGFAARVESLPQIATTGAEALQLDLDEAIAPFDLTGQLVYYAVPPARRAGDPRLDRFLESILGAPKRLIYLSSTGVYGNHAGARVDEDTPPAPHTDRAARRLAIRAMRSRVLARAVFFFVRALGSV